MSKARKPAATVPGLTAAICKDNSFAQDAGGKLYRYVDGAYRRRAEEYIKGRVKQLCVEQKHAAAWTSRLGNESVEFIRVDSPMLWERPPVDLVNVRNGLLRVADRELLPHTPEHRCTVQLPVKYDPDARPLAIEAFVKQTFPDDAHDLAWEVPAWLMRPVTSIQKAVLLTGEGSNGKSTWLELLTRFLGKPNTVSVSLHKLEVDQFAVARLVGKLANICADLPSEHLAGTSVFKALTGGDTLCAEYKFKDSFDFEPFCRLVFSANHAPRSQDASHAFFRRWIVLPFDRTFGPSEQIPRETLDRRLSMPDELSGMLNRALDALPRLESQRGFSEPESIKTAWQDFHATTDPLAVWLARHTVDDPETIAPVTTLRAAYNADAMQHGRPGLNETQFGLSLRRLRPRIERTQRVINGKRQWAYVGIGYTHEGNGQ